jgi:hypothetical protein
MHTLSFNNRCVNEMCVFLLAGELSELHPYFGAHRTRQAADMWDQLLQARVQGLFSAGQT